MDWKANLLQSSSVLVPLLWSQVGPMVIRLMTAWANTAHAYIPREYQVIVSAIVGALLAGFSGGGAEVVTLSASGGALAQYYAGADPKTMRTSKE